MLHPSYSDLMEAVNSNVEPGEQPVVQSRYSIVIAAAKRARQLIGGADPLIYGAIGKKPLSTAVEELYEQQVTILPEEEEPEEGAAPEEAVTGEAPMEEAAEEEDASKAANEADGEKDTGRGGKQAFQSFSFPLFSIGRFWRKEQKYELTFHIAGL